MKLNNPCEFPEKLFESLVNHELMNSFSKLSKKVILWSPSQSKEASLGYDALFKSGVKKLIAIQYKIPKRKYSRKHIGCFRFDLHKNKRGECKQHGLLCDLLAKHVVDDVVYCVPLFVENSKLNNYARSETLTKMHVAQIRPKRLISIKGSHHCVYDSRTADFYCNNKTETNLVDFDELFFCQPDRTQIRLGSRKKLFKEIIDNNKKELFGVMFYSVF